MKKIESVRSVDRVRAAGPQAVAILVALMFGHSTRAADQPTVAYFENHVRPVLVERCIKCHGAKKSESELRLDSMAAVRKGGISGPAVTPGKPDRSLLIQAVRREDGLEMPPDEKLDDQQIAALVRWVQDGAVWPDGAALGGGSRPLRGGPLTDEERAFWSFQPIRDPTPPEVNGDPIGHDIDRFVIARLREANLQPMPRAERRTLIRRASFDLTGLPPTPDEIQSFLADDSPDAFARVVDRLLDSRAYGERWGRHWLDVVRYADTAGETADYPTPLAYKYRNWVINAFHADMPYDQFVREQIAGDILARQMIASYDPPSSPDGKQTAESGRPGVGSERSAEALARYESMLTATGFIAISRRFGFDVENYHHLTIQDTIDTVGKAFLGLSLGCARCHDHKYDPVNTADYYAWYGIFDSTRYSFPGSEEKKRPYDLFPVLPAAESDRAKAEFDAALAQIEKEIAELEAEPVAGRLDELRARRDAMKKSGPYELVYAAIEKDSPQDSRIQLRGEPHKPGDQVPRKNLEILGKDLLPADAGSGRLQLADWLTREDNPLMSRVMVNRIWQHHFGCGLVATENDFGTRGRRPSHPELLDWLATRFRENGYSVKAMHRLIMASATYQRSSDFDADAFAADPDSALLWRFNRRRLSGEEIRDAMLLVSGTLDPTTGGEHPFPPVESWGFTQHAPFYAVYPTNRRSVYLMQQRLKRHPFLALFDGADTNVSTARRELTTVPTQALYLMNSDFVHQQGAALANRLIGGSDEQAARIATAYQIALGRLPNPEEVEEAAAFVQRYTQALVHDDSTPQAREQEAWSALARTMLTRNEFLFVD